MATTRFETAAQIVKDAAAQLGLAVVADPLASTEVLQVRLCGCLNIAGRELVTVYEWPHLRKACDIVAALGDGRAWTLPGDFAGLVPDTVWNQTQDRLITGPIDALTWARYEATDRTPVQSAFRIVQGVLAVIPTSSVTDGDALQYEYQGKSWTSATGGTAPTDDRVSVGTDVVYFDPLLMHWAVRRAWRTSIGESTAVEESAYWQAVERCKGAETTGAVLSIIPRRPTLGLPQAPEGVWNV